MDENFANMFKTSKEIFCESVTDHISISKDDLTETEKKIIDYSFGVLKERLEDIKILNDEVKRLNLELVNLRSYGDDTEYFYD